MIKRKLRPTSWKVLVRLIDVEAENEKRSEGGIIIKAFTTAQENERAQYATQEAYVIDIGPTAFQAYDSGESWCKVGDRVLICKYSGEDRTDLEEDKIHRLINDKDILGVFEGEGLND